MARGHETVLPDEAGYAASVRRATLFLGLLYQFMQFVISSTLWAFLGYDPIAIAPITLILMLNGTLMSYAMGVALFRFRGRSILFKLLLGSALALVAAAINASVDLLSHGLIEHGDPGPINWTNVGYTLIYCMALFHGWAFLYIALLANYELRERERRLAVTREEALTAQMRALRYQVNPHFLFNTLNSIAGLIEEGASTTARRMVLSLSSFLRTTLERDPMQDVCLADELALQLGYLNIEGERFSDRMRVKLDIAPGLEQALVPSLILQPLIENAIKHGVGGSIGVVEIVIRAARQGETLELSVENDMANEPPRPAIKPAGTGTGLRNVADRIKARFPEVGAFISGLVAPHRFRAAITMPLRLV
ncbi:sensor histidine kinase [Ensifer adhaerens]|uniref:sensor histidine kinase n=1 Tax=Ensifer adhaerens TaxID=106592 RepID=UPI000DC3680D|nr:histidine kinase [Ensifer adhaerens]RAS14094.1 histidine kinase [Ensifer adhaerens]